MLQTKYQKQQQTLIQNYKDIKRLKQQNILIQAQKKKTTNHVPSSVLGFFSYNKASTAIEAKRDNGLRFLPFYD